MIQHRSQWNQRDGLRSFRYLSSASSRGQVMIEFLIISMIAIIIGIVYLVVSNALLVDIGEQQRISALNDIGYAVQDELITAAMVEDGYERTFTIPVGADRFVYTLNSTNDSLVLTSGPISISYVLPLYTGELRKGANRITKRGQALQVTA